TAESARIGLSGNLCRCTGYEKIVASAMAAEDSTRVLEDEREQHTAGTAVIAAATSESDDKHDHSSANASQHASGVTPVPCSGRTRFEGIDVHTPSTLADALDALATMPDDFCLFAGGTDLSVELSTGRTVAKRILNLWQLDELRGIREDADGLRIGALSTCADLIESKLTAWTADILVQAARSSGAAQIQNRATLGGNLGTASPAADFAPALIALGAKVRLVSTSGQREVLVEDFLCGYRQTLMEAGELIESVWIPGRGADEGRAFRKVGTRRAQSIAKVVLALSLEFEGEGAARRIRVVRAGAGSVAARTCRLPAFEAAMLGCSPSQPDFRACVEAAARLAAETDVTPMSDVRSTAAYRRRSLRRVLASMTLAASRPELAFQPS
ncbi:MAG: xanthine dehydrogenase iron-sulfur cluster and FAD-binding subunit A, partial [Planctomycetota bacterium]